MSDDSLAADIIKARDTLTSAGIGGAVSIDLVHQMVSLQLLDRIVTELQAIRTQLSEKGE